MLDWLRKDVSCAGSVLFRGSIPPRRERIESLRDEGMEVAVLEPSPEAHWAVTLNHPEWGEATVVCLRDLGPPPRVLAEVDVHLTPEERGQIALAGSVVSLSVTGRRKHVLRDRKMMLRFLHAVMGEHGLAAMDHVAQRFWSRAALEDELSHDADLDVDGIFSLHAVTDKRDAKRSDDDEDQDDDGPPIRWLHSHGLAEIGFFDFDILNAAPGLLGHGYDALRAIVFMILEGRLGRNTARATVIVPGGDVRSVPVPEFERRAAPKYAALRQDPERDHARDRVVLCDPAGRLLGRWFDKVRPSRFFSEPLPETGVHAFSTEASELMAERARKTYPMFRRVCEELAEFEFPVIVKLGYEVDGSTTEHEYLWFEVHELGDEEIDATLANEPFKIARMQAGQRARHPVGRLNDWQILTPLGMVNPRQTVALRILRAHREEFLQAMREAEAEDAET